VGMMAFGALLQWQLTPPPPKKDEISIKKAPPPRSRPIVVSD